jgi:hypothetical protein
MINLNNHKRYIENYISRTIYTRKQTDQYFTNLFNQSIQSRLLFMVNFFTTFEHF